MQKLKISIINKLIGVGATSKEIDFLIYAARYQDDTGTIKGVYYKDVCSHLKISYQTFYDVKKSLQEKDIICVKRESDIDWDITINNNDFTNVDFKNIEDKDCYLSIDYKLFYDSDFHELKANEKLLAMLLTSYTKNWHFEIYSSNFYDNYTKLLGITKRVLTGYLKSLRKFFTIVLKDFKYFITPKVKTHQANNGKSDAQLCNENIVEVICRRNKIKDFSSSELEDTAELINQYKKTSKWGDINIVEAVIKSIYDSLEQLNRYKGIKDKALRSLRPKLIHKILREQLGIN